SQGQFPRPRDDRSAGRLPPSPGTRGAPRLTAGTAGGRLLRPVPTRLRPGGPDLRSTGLGGSGHTAAAGSRSASVKFLCAGGGIRQNSVRALTEFWRIPLHRPGNRSKVPERGLATAAFGRKPTLRLGILVDSPTCSVYDKSLPPQAGAQRPGKVGPRAGALVLGRENDVRLG